MYCPPCALDVLQHAEDGLVEFMRERDRQLVQRIGCRRLADLLNTYRTEKHQLVGDAQT